MVPRGALHLRNHFTSAMPALRTLKIFLSGFSQSAPWIPPDNLFGCSTPALRKVEIGSALYVPHSTMLRNSTHLRLDEIYSNAVDILNCLPNNPLLEVLILRYATTSSMPLISRTTAAHQESVPLPSLKTCDIICQHPENGLEILSHLIMPSRTRCHMWCYAFTGAERFWSLPLETFKLNTAHFTDHCC